MTRERILAILEEHVIGDGQGFPEQCELEAAADALVAELTRPKRDRKTYMREYMRERRANKNNNIAK